MRESWYKIKFTVQLSIIDNSSWLVFDMFPPFSHIYAHNLLLGKFIYFSPHWKTTIHSKQDRKVHEHGIYMSRKKRCSFPSRHNQSEIFFASSLPREVTTSNISPHKLHTHLFPHFSIAIPIQKALNSILTTCDVESCKCKHIWFESSAQWGWGLQFLI